jgi:hypothetical protein
MKPLFTVITHFETKQYVYLNYTKDLITPLQHSTLSYAIYANNRTHLTAAPAAPQNK